MMERFPTMIDLLVYLWSLQKTCNAVIADFERTEVIMDKNELTPWEFLILAGADRLARETHDNIISRTSIQREIQPIMANSLKEILGYKIGRTPENTVDRVIQDLEKKGFLEMQFRRGGKRGTYKVNVMKTSKILRNQQIQGDGVLWSHEKARSDAIAVASPSPDF